LKVNSPSQITSETLVLTASIKPYINLVWGGTDVIVIGFIFSIVGRYRRLKSKSSDEDEIITNGEVKLNGNLKKEKELAQKN
jgi:hypothetical protein